MNKQNNRPKARLPRGFRDRRADEIAAERKMLETIRSVYESYGFDALETPSLEYTEALGKFLPDVERPNEGVFSLQDDDEKWLSLRYDLTAPLARFVATKNPGRDGFANLRNSTPIRWARPRPRPMPSF
jgi:histidyl-tRNA synthetase